ncbi:HAD family hydrolase [Ammoniphilus resinae]|uniref:Pyrophosphatase PpaX n=1 Tax=Ammoniphilus resinae TaxID=861532 RepID=A0ABS4GPM6_9BACL|nr:HAD-IA family hydrolase [Ammoniphilus resinae]MBP1932216.1 pyrophosphatase PpaX [Ammoniphilus resinae]
MKMTRCLLFDLDGTLLDSRDVIIDGVHYLTEKYVPGLFTRKDLLKRFGEPIDDLLDIIEQSLRDKQITKQQMLDSYFTYINTHHDEQVQLFPYVKEGLYSLKSAGYQLGIVTNKQREFTMRGLQTAGILPFFNTIVTLDDVAVGKPSPEMLIKSMKEIGVTSESSLMIGDSKYDLLAARAAKVPFTALEWYGPEDWQGNSAPNNRYPNFQQFVQDLLTIKLR